MSDLFLQFAAMIVTATLAIHGIALSFQLGHLVIDGLRIRAMPGIAPLAALWQTMGITCALCGFVLGGALCAADFAGLFLRTDTPHTLRVRVVGNRIQAWIGDKAVINLEDNSIGTGRVGLATFRSKAAFTTLRVVER